MKALSIEEVWWFGLVGANRKVIVAQKENLKLLSIAIGSNIPGYKSKCWIRKSSEPDAEIALVKKFVDEIHNIWKLKQAHVPAYIHEGLEKIDALKTDMKMKGAKFQDLFVIECHLRINLQGDLKR